VGYQEFLPVSAGWPRSRFEQKDFSMSRNNHRADRIQWGLSNGPRMQLICARTISFLDVDSLETRKAREALLRGQSGFMLYLSDGAPPPSCNERLISLEAREALLWLSEEAEPGSFWE